MAVGPAFCKFCNQYGCDNPEAHWAKCPTCDYAFNGIEELESIEHKCVLKKKLEQALAREAFLKDDLEKARQETFKYESYVVQYGSHLSSCQFRKTRGEFVCNCGWAEVFENIGNL